MKTPASQYLSCIEKLTATTFGFFLWPPGNSNESPGWQYITLGAREVAGRLGALAALGENLGSVPSTQRRMAHNHLKL